MAEVGRSFGRYRLLERIGAGGSGDVWRASDAGQSARSVALKLLRAELSADEWFRNRFRHEAEVASRLTEPHIVPIHGHGDVDGHLYIDMRLVEGGDLHQLLARRRTLPPARAVEVVGQLAAALDAVHGAGLLHRNIQPSNVLLADGGNEYRPDFAYLAGFGSVRLLGRPSDQPPGLEGSRAYYAPEEFEGRTAIDHRCDVFGLAYLLYECLCGQRPFVSGSVAGAVHAILTAPRPKPSQTWWRLRAFDEIVARGLAIDPGDRYTSAGQLADAARQALSAPNSAVFVSYRRYDSTAAARAVADRLSRLLGADDVFLDVTTIRAGRDFRAALDEAIDRAVIMVVLIGRHWLGATPGGWRRIDDPEDYVRIETERGLAAGLTMIPVLLDGALMPGPNVLPPSLAALTSRQGVPMSDRTFESDMARLVRSVLVELGQAARHTPATPQGPDEQPR
jgi:hypothetical protein